MKKINVAFLGIVFLFVMVCFAKPVYAEEYQPNPKITLTISSKHSSDKTISPRDGSDVHFLWDKSYYIDENGVKHENALKNHPDYLEWVLDSKKDVIDMEWGEPVSKNDAKVIKEKLGASDKFYRTIISKKNGFVTKPSVNFEYSDMVVDHSFTYKPESAKLKFRIYKNSVVISKKMKVDTCYYQPYIEGSYKMIISSSDGAKLAELVIPVSCKINYQFKYNKNLSDDNNQGELYAWRGMVIDDLLDGHWFLGTVYKMNDAISTDIVLEPGEKLQLALSEQNYKEGVVCKERAAYYKVTPTGLVRCKKKDILYDFGYNPSIIKINKTCMLTAIKPGTARVDLYYPKTGSFLSYKITVRESAKPVKFKKIKKLSKNKYSLSWERCKTATGYEIQYSTNKNFKNAKKIVIAKNKTTSTVLKNMKAKKYYFRIRSYKTKWVFDKYIPKEYSYTSKEKTFYSKWTKL